MDKNYFRNVIILTALVYVTMFVGSLIPLSFGFMNPFKKGLADYEYTDLIFSKFKSEINFDDRIVIVNVGKPDRSKIAEALEIIHSFEPSAIGVDIVFEGLKDSVADTKLSRVIGAISNLILADELKPDMYDEFPTQCHPIFCDDSNTAYINFVAKPNYSIRYFSPHEVVGENRVDGFAVAIIRKADKKAYSNLIKRQNQVEQIHYRGIADSYVHIEMTDLDTTEEYKSILRDKIVLLGYSGTDEWAMSSKDKFFTPMNKNVALKALPDMFGVAIHANIISMMLDDEYINEMPLGESRIFCLIIVVGMLFILRKMYYKINPGYWKSIRFVQLFAFFILFVISTIMFYFFHYKMNLTTALIGIVLSWDVLKIYEGVYIKKQKLFQPKREI